MDTDLGAEFRLSNWRTVHEDCYDSLILAFSLGVRPEVQVKMPEDDKPRRVAYNCAEWGNTLSREPTAANSYLARESPTLDGLNERWRCNVREVQHFVR